MAWAPNLLISVPLGISAPLPSAPPPHDCPAGWRPLHVRAADSGGGKLCAPPHHPRPPPRGRLGAAFIPPHPSRLLAFPPLSPSTLGSCRRRRTLCCGAAGTAAAAVAGAEGLAAATRAGGWTAPGGWTARSLSRRLSGSRAQLARLGSRPPPPGFTAALRRHRGGGRCLSPAPRSLPPLQPHHVGVRILHPSRPDFSLPLFRRREWWREATRLQRRGPPSRPACKVLL